MRPHVGAITGEPSAATPVKAMRPDGIAKLGLFGKLNASIFTSSVRGPPTENRFTSEASIETSPGPMSVLRPRLSRVLTVGSWKQFTSQYRSHPPSTGLGEQPGLRSGRSCREKPVVLRLPDRLKPSSMVNG